MRPAKSLIYLIVVCAYYTCSAQFDGYTNHYADNNGVKIHYVTKGEGPVLIFLHGFPDFWFTWKYQMDALSESYKVVGVDLRGYNYSEGPEEVSAYKMVTLMKDIAFVINDLGTNKVTLIANDWGGAIAWQLATYYPEKISRLIVCNIPHPSSLRNYLQAHPETADYTKKNVSPKATEYWTIDQLMKSSGALDSDLEKEYSASFERSNIQGMLHYYTASYPKPSKQSTTPTKRVPQRLIQCPVLMIHGLDDKAFPPGTLNDHWQWVDNNFTLNTLPGVGHFVQREAPDIVLRLISEWLKEK